MAVLNTLSWCPQIMPAMVKRLPPPLKALVWMVNKFKLDKRMAMKVIMFTDRDTPPPPKGTPV